MGTLYTNSNGNITAQTYTASSTSTAGKPANQLTTAQINAIVSPAKGMIAVDTTLNVIKYYDGTVWQTAASLNDLINLTGVESIRFTNSVISRKIILFDAASPSNDHQFVGFGVNSGILRSQIRLTTDNFAWYAASSSTSSNELMRLNGAGFLGIQTTTPHAPLQFSNSSENRKIVLFEQNNNDHQFAGFGINTGVLRYQLSHVLNSHVFYAAASSSASTELFRITGSGFVGIGSSTPHAPLQFAAATANRKIVLFEVTDNDHQFYGFGVNSNALRYQVDQTASNHVFYAATSSSASNELVRITGTGFLGIQTSAPHAMLQLANTSGNRKIVLKETVDNDHEFLGFGNGPSALQFQTDSTSSSFNWFCAQSSSASIELMRLKYGSGFGAGFLGIGTDPHAPLHIGGNVNTNRRIVLFEVTDNDHQFFGFGTATGVLRNQIPATASNFGWYAATSSSASNLIMLLTGTGNLGIGSSSPNAPLQFASATANRKIVLYEGTNNDHQFYGLGVNSSTLRYQVDQTASNHSFFAATSSSTSNELFRVMGIGGYALKVGSNQRTDSAILVGGTIAISNTSVTGNTVAFAIHKTFSGVVGVLRCTTNPGVGLTVISSSGSDTSEVRWFLYETFS